MTTFHQAQDVPEGPAQIDCFLKVKAVERVALVGHSGKCLIVLRIGLNAARAFLFLVSCATAVGTFAE